MAGRKTEKALRTNNCLYCGTEFEGHYNRKFCTMRCKDAYKVRKPMGYEDTCVVCGKDYPVNYGKLKVKDKVCSVACSNILHSSKTGRHITIEEIAEIVIESETQPTVQGICDLLGTSKTTVLTRAKENYGSFRKMVKELRGKYLDSTKNGIGFTASMLFNLLDDMGFNGSREYTFDDLRNPDTNVLLRLDYFIEDMPLAIEYHGQQHYMYIPYFHDKTYRKYTTSFEYFKEKDKMKVDYLQKNGIPLIVWRYDEPVSREEVERRFARFLV